MKIENEEDQNFSSIKNIVLGALHDIFERQAAPFNRIKFAFVFFKESRTDILSSFLTDTGITGLKTSESDKIDFGSSFLTATVHQLCAVYSTSNTIYSVQYVEIAYSIHWYSRRLAWTEQYAKELGQRIQQFNDKNTNLLALCKVLEV